MALGDEAISEDGWKIPDLRALRRDRIGFIFQAPYPPSQECVTPEMARPWKRPARGGLSNNHGRMRTAMLSAGVRSVDVQNDGEGVEKHPEQIILGDGHLPAAFLGDDAAQLGAVGEADHYLGGGGTADDA
mgnify:FL=1